ncbi:TraB/GumN family protein [Haliangium ochraceum]|uniref:GumN family protein n=1 Tax=Haliangium ochraceum (strain DSM 14365 / JCM 11303 / SMP-2) TaxID=502025 RepID=D0LIH4_HALO1|nr:TraB/GumN family protein [Haliangium ochraceum]ACY18330.1 GumN family protein [Haliangium ochraceum DSM 14365]
MQHSPSRLTLAAAHRRAAAPSVALAAVLAASLVALSALSGCKSEPKQAPVAESPSAEEAAQPAAAPEEPAAEAPAAPDNPIAKPFFWEARRDGDVDYLLGTMHAKYELDDLPAQVRERLAQADTVVVETDISKVDVAAVMQKAMLPPSQSLRTMLGEDRWEILVGEVGEKFPPAALDRMQPWFVGVLVAYGDLMGNDPSKSMDMQVVRRAQEDEKTLAYLEEPNAQLDLLAELGDLDSLKESIDDLDTIEAMVDEMVETYGSGDLEALRKITFESETMMAEPEQIEKLLLARNRAWMEILPDLFSDKTVFVAVGAGHFPGDDGLIDLLQEAGYEVVRIIPDSAADPDPAPAD